MEAYRAAHRGPVPVSHSGYPPGNRPKSGAWAATGTGHSSSTTVSTDRATGDKPWFSNIRGRGYPPSRPGGRGFGGYRGSNHSSSERNGERWKSSEFRGGARNHYHQRQETEHKNPVERLTELISEEPNEAVLALVSERSGFLKYYTYTKITDTRLLELLVRALAHACQSTFSPQALSRLLKAVNESGFLSGPLLNHLVSCGCQDLDASLVKNVADVVKSLLHHLPSSSLSSVTQLLSQLNCWTQLNKLEADFGASQTIKEAEEMKKEVSKQIKIGDVVRDQELGQIDYEDEPPDDFRKIPSIPTSTEIKSEEPPFLRKNIIFGAYRDVNHYLDVQYRLLREDFICPLREGLKTMREFKDKNISLARLSDIRFYRGVQILTPYCTQRCVMYRARFDVTQFQRVRWESSKRLIYGSLIGLSKDNFENIIFGTIANRNPEDLKKGIVEICFEETSLYLLDPNPFTVYQMVECSAYFEAYRHVLQGLQEIKPGSLPFEKYLLNNSTSASDVQAPRYLRGNNAQYDFSSIIKGHSQVRNVPPLKLDAWPTPEKLGLDLSQYKALQTAMTKEFVTIQGPPGTGKTFIGLKIVQLLLSNSDYWDGDQSPILVVCFTNHALDQFLEGIIGMCGLSAGEIVRVGGRSTSENKVLQASSLFEIKKRDNVRNTIIVQNAIRDVREAMGQIQDDITRHVSEMEFTRKNILHENYLRPHMTEAQSRSLFSRPYSPHLNSVFPEWLCLNEFSFVNNDGAQNRESVEPEEQVIEDDEDEVTRLQQERQMDDTVVLTQRQQHLKTIKEQSEMLHTKMGLMDTNEANDDNDDASAEKWEHVKKPKKKNNAAVHRNLRQNQAMTHEQWMAVQNVWRLPIVDRWCLYNYWASCYCEEKSILVRNLCSQYNRHASDLGELNTEEDYQVLRKARVVGMTTTGAAKYRLLVQRMHPKIVIVEEAAEVLEAHIVTTLSARCEHLIMIGDHQQLRPNPTVYKLAKQYHLDISLFERMVKNDLHCDRLTIQHRMRPEIVKLIVPHVYKSLENHESVLKYDSIRGVKGNLYFITHTEVEKSVEDTRSRSNMHEASFVASLCQYLIQQGYKPTQISILTMYTGQMFLLRKMLPKSAFEGVRITPVDNYQGEENDIILLSLVRSNEEGKIGFLQTHNRVCVALSRARMGLYVIGNMEMMADASVLWNGITKELKACNQLVDALPLACQNHPENAIAVKCHEDFKNVPEGGCMLDCGYRLSCGHVCKRKCHPTDKLHEEYVCMKPCAKIICELGHRCTKVCYLPCGGCQVRVEKTMPKCGHVQKMKCHISVIAFVCQVPCEKILNCGHKCQTVCGAECTEQCLEIVPDREWPCGHKLAVACHLKWFTFPCNITVSKQLSCGHKVDMKCSDDVNSFKCTEKVTYTLCNDVTHTHQTVCHRLAESRQKKCNQMVTVVCSRDPKHQYKTKCCDRDTQSCPRPCSSTLPCGHLCAGNCETCADSGIHKPCTTTCQKQLSCQHRCKASCSEACPPCMDLCVMHCGHKQCTQQCGSVCDQCQLPCLWRCKHHVCQLACHEPCTRLPCDQPCPRNLRCGHRCIGLCGEPCPPWCRICNQRNVEQMAHFLQIENYSAKSRFVHLMPCGHVIEVRHMDKWVESSTPQPLCTPQCVTCPVCKQTVGLCPRYGSRIKSYTKNINAIKKASSASTRIGLIVDQAVSSLWPADRQIMKHRLMDTNQAAADAGADRQRPTFYGLALGAVCIWQECCNLLQLCQRKEQNRQNPGYMVALGDKHRASLDSMRMELIEAVETMDYKQAVKTVLGLHMMYLQLHVRRMQSFIKNPRLLRLLVTLSSQTTLKITQLIAINNDLKNNFSLLQRENVEDCLDHLNMFFQPKLTTELQGQKWLICQNDHVFSAPVSATDPRCSVCRPRDEAPTDTEHINIQHVIIQYVASSVSKPVPRAPLTARLTVHEPLLTIRDIELSAQRLLDRHQYKDKDSDSDVEMEPWF